MKIIKIKTIHNVFSEDVCFKKFSHENIRFECLYIILFSEKIACTKENAENSMKNKKKKRSKMKNILSYFSIFVKIR